MKSISLSLLYLLLLLGRESFALPPQFVNLRDIAPTIIHEIRYASSENFIGRRINGYAKAQCILTKIAALRLLQIERLLQSQNLGLKVYDCYRPQMAVNDFILWSQRPNDDSKRASYYPRIEKPQLFKLDYIAYQSGHTRGSTVDLTLIQLNNKKEIDMGTPFDFLDPLSHPASKSVGISAYKNRQFLRKIMLQNGFRPLATEWWHFTLNDEPYPNEYFNFPVK